MKKYEIIATVGSKGCGTTLHEVVIGSKNDMLDRLQEISTEYGGFSSLSVFENGIKFYDSSWNA